MKTVFIALFCLFGTVGLSVRAHAEESQFGYVYTTDLLPKDQKEIIQWGTYSTGQGRGTYNLLQGRTGGEYGVTDDFQIALYANYAYADVAHNGLGGITQTPSAVVGARPGADEFGETRYTGTSLEGIYRVLSPYEDGIGLAVLVEPTFGTNLREFDNRIILQKNYLDDRLIFAGNIEWIAEQLLPAGASSWQPHSIMAADLAGSYRFVSNWSAGLEFFNQHDFGSISPGNHLDSVFYLGPSIHFGGESYFVTFTTLAQLPFGSNYANPGAVDGGRVMAPNFSAWQGRVKFGYYF